ncbi:MULTISPECIES: hypothetical protein [unclassified Brevibacterium]|uniref:hypothetical protein n=1 Tax=unclassified Brevibacterium TaxID=2614124 RepID=UPI0008A1D7CD|nr:MULTISPECIES: hypothetical protein [unclassified Brevibacterium]OFL66378.1 hypothetical protein HMPREF2757_03155 [Brevibacterium sp. HMSC063G07]OFS27774.1 hypothetical protein HMPREF3162_00840 [Brevibacterium sp. HMSC07C04]
MEYLKVLLPSIVVGLLFWYVLRAIIKSDSTERKEMDRYYAEMEIHKAQRDNAQRENAAQPREVSEEPRKDEHDGSQSDDRPH